MAITPMFQVDLRSKQAQRDNRRTKIPYVWRFPLHSPLAGAGTVRATPADKARHRRHCRSNKAAPYPRRARRARAGNAGSLWSRQKAAASPNQLPISQAPRAAPRAPLDTTQRHRSRLPSNNRHRAAPCPRRAHRDLLWAARSPRRPPEAAGSLKTGTDEPPNEGAARAAPGRHAAPPKPPPLKQTPHGCSMPAPCTPGPFVGRQIPTAPPWGRRLAKSRCQGTSTWGCCSCCLGSPRSATEAAAPQTNATRLLHARAVHAGSFCGPPVLTAHPWGRRLAKTRYR